MNVLVKKISTKTLLETHIFVPTRVVNLGTTTKLC